MTTKTDYHAFLELRNAYTPAQRGIVTDAEAQTIRRILELDTRNDIELQNIRDVCVMQYSSLVDPMLHEDGEYKTGTLKLLDAMSAVCAVIDREKVERGLEV